MTEAELLHGCLKNDRLAQRELYNRYCAKMFGVCLRYVKNRDEAEDVLQTGFVKVFRSLETFRSQGSMEGWIRRIMVNTALENLRAQKRQLDFTSMEKIPQLASEEDLDTDLSAEELVNLVNELPAGFRMIFNLYVVEGFNHREIAEQLGINEGTSKSQLSRARSILQEKLRKLSTNNNNPVI